MSSLSPHPSEIPDSSPVSHAPPAPPAPQPAKAGKVGESFAEDFAAIKIRTGVDRSQKLKLNSERLFVLVPVTKEKLSIKTKKENRSLNVQQRLKLMHKELSTMKNAGGKALFTPSEISKILREYKLKLKEVKLSETEPAKGAIQVKDAASFLEYLRANQASAVQITQGPLNRLLENSGADLTARLDGQFVMRQAGAQKAVYLKGDHAIATPRTDSDKKFLEKEYDLTVKMRVNAMRDFLKARLPEDAINNQAIQSILTDYEKALEDPHNPHKPDVVDATSYFQSLKDDSPILQHGLFSISRGADGKSIRLNEDQRRLKALEVGAEIDKSLSGMDVARKKIVEGDRVYYRSPRGMDDLNDFLKSPEMKNLSPTQFNELMGSFEGIRSSMQKADLLHGDIKPDNIFVYKEEIEGKPPKYSFKISDFGQSQVFEKSQFATARQVRAGNTRWHKGFYDTPKTQEMSLNMLKLLIINAGTSLQPTPGTEEAVAKAHEKLLARAPKVSDVAQDAMDLGAYMYRTGDTSVIGSSLEKVANLFRKTKKIDHPKVKYNYFSNIDKSVVSTGFRALLRGVFHPGKNKRMERNTYHSALRFLGGVNEQFKPSTAADRALLSPEQQLALLQKEQLHYTKMKTSLELLENMFSSSSFTVPPNFDVRPLKSSGKKLDELQPLITAAEQAVARTGLAAQPREKLEPPLPPDLSPEEEVELALEDDVPIAPPAPLGVEESVPPPPSELPPITEAQKAVTGELSVLFGQMKEMPLTDAKQRASYQINLKIAAQDLVKLEGMSKFPPEVLKPLQKSYEAAWAKYLRAPEVQESLPPLRAQPGTHLGRMSQRLAEPKAAINDLEELKPVLKDTKKTLEEAHHIHDMAQQALSSARLRKSAKLRTFEFRSAAIENTLRAAVEVHRKARDLQTALITNARAAQIFSRLSSDDRATYDIDTSISTSIRGLQTVEEGLKKAPFSERGARTRLEKQHQDIIANMAHTAKQIVKQEQFAQDVADARAALVIAQSAYKQAKADEEIPPPPPPLEEPAEVAAAPIAAPKTLRAPTKTTPTRATADASKAPPPPPPRAKTPPPPPAAKALTEDLEPYTPVRRPISSPGAQSRYVKQAPQQPLPSPSRYKKQPPTSLPPSEAEPPPVIPATKPPPPPFSNKYSPEGKPLSQPPEAS